MHTKVFCCKFAAACRPGVKVAPDVSDFENNLNFKVGFQNIFTLKKILTSRKKLFTLFKDGHVQRGESSRLTFQYCSRLEYYGIYLIAWRTYGPILGANAEKEETEIYRIPLHDGGEDMHVWCFTLAYY